MEERPSHLFVYGTLRRGSNNKFSRFLAGHAQFLGHARMRGHLYRIGSYAGAVISGQPAGWVHGEVYRLADPAKILPPLDGYEGAEFERAIAPVRLDDGRSLEAWVYLLRGKRRGRRIPI